MLHANDLLDSRIIEYGSFKPVYYPASVKDAIEEIITLVKFTIKDRKLKILAELPTWRYLKFDKRRLQQVLLNLLDNAVKFSNEGNIIVIPKLIRQNEKLLLQVSI